MGSLPNDIVCRWELNIVCLMPALLASIPFGVDVLGQGGESPARDGPVWNWFSDSGVVVLGDFGSNISPVRYGVGWAAVGLWPALYCSVTFSATARPASSVRSLPFLGEPARAV